jgi:tetratricopeptide (TPR) repeat protein
MLTDLEERHSYYRNQDQVVFGDLTPIADTGFSRARIPYNFLLMCFFLIAIAVAFYSYTVNESAGQYYPDSALSTAAVTESIAREATALTSDMPLPVVHQLAGLKLDLAVPLVSSPPSLQVAVVQAIDSSERNAEMKTNADRNALSINPAPAQADKIELIPAMTTVATVEEASFGQMDIRPSTSTPAMLMGRLLVEAKTLYSRRDFRQADEKVQGILKQQPLHIEARLLYTSALISRDNMASAMQVLAEGLQLNPGISEWAKVYAKLLVDQGQTVQAVEVLTYGLPQISQDQDYYAFYAALLQGLARHDEAAEFYRALLGQQPENRLWWMGLGISLDALNNSDDAVYAYSRALEGDTLNNELRQYVLEQTERLRR